MLYLSRTLANYTPNPYNTPMTRIKICGITTQEHAHISADAGADAIGLVFYPPSPRHIALDNAAEIVNSLPPYITTVALFVNPEPSEVRRVLDAVNPDCLQFHGNETNDFCQQFTRKWYKALPVKLGVDIQMAMAAYPDSSAILLDTWHETLPGGSGKCFDWSLIPATISKPLILAGGLAPDNVREAIEQVRPWAVDVSGGVESSRGGKDSTRITTFINNVKNT
jgi:phosphoribosylanthranilate isomerase